MNTTRGDRKQRAGRVGRVIRMIVHGAAVATFVTGGTVAVAMAAGAHHPGFQSAPAQVVFTDAAGNVQTGPVFDVSGAYPDMQPQRSVIRLRNTSELTQTFSVTAQVQPTGPRSLDRVLRIRVIDRSSGAALYVGRLSTLHFKGSTLRAGRSASYLVEVRWPETPDDNAYQGASLSIQLTTETVAA